MFQLMQLSLYLVGVGEQGIHCATRRKNTALDDESLKVQRFAVHLVTAVSIAWTGLWCPQKKNLEFNHSHFRILCSSCIGRHPNLPSEQTLFLYCPAG